MIWREKKELKKPQKTRKRRRKATKMWQKKREKWWPILQKDSDCDIAVCAAPVRISSVWKNFPEEILGNLEILRCWFSLPEDSGLPKKPARRAKKGQCCTAG